MRYLRLRARRYWCIFKTRAMSSPTVLRYTRKTVGEDMDLVLKMHQYLRARKRKYRIYFVPDPVCWTEVPVHWRQIARQRDRWQRGQIESLRAHEQMMLNPRYGI